MAQVVGSGSHSIEFEHPEVGLLVVKTGADRIAWGYALNTVTWPTYAGEVVQILSCFVDDLEITGTLQTPGDMETLYTFFIQYAQVATQGDPRRGQKSGHTSYNEQPMTMRYPHRGWEMKVMPKSMPGYHKGRDLVTYQWQIQAHVVDDDAGDVDSLKDLIIKEAEIKMAIQSKGPDDDTNFALQGKIHFEDENPFSDPFTSKGTNFAQNPSQAFQQIGDFYSKLLPAYLQGDFSALSGGLGSKPAFTADPNVRTSSAIDTDSNANKDGTAGQQKKANKIRRK